MPDNIDGEYNSLIYRHVYFLYQSILKFTCDSKGQFMV